MIVIKFFKLWNGEEVVAEVEDDEGWCEMLDLRKPFRNMLTQQGMMLVPYPCDFIQLQTNHIIFTGEANQDLANAYRQATGGVVVAKNVLEVPR